MWIGTLIVIKKLYRYMCLPLFSVHQCLHWMLKHNIIHQLEK
jgi:hypothetical protein